MTIFSLLFLLLTCIIGIAVCLHLPLPLTNWVKFVIGPAIGIILETEIILLLSLILGLNPTTVWLALILFTGFTGTVVAFSLIPPRGWNTFTPRVSYRKILSKIFSLILDNWPFVILGLIVGIAAIFVFWTKVLYPNDWGLITGGGGLYGDTALHASYTTSLVYQGMPPVNPLFAGSPLIYPFLVNLFSATLVLLGSNLRFAFILPQILYFVAFFSLFYTLAKRLSGNTGAFLAMLIFFLGWGLGFTVYIQDSLKSGSWLITHEYSNNIDGFTFHNVLTGLIFPERSFLPGLVIGLLITHLMLHIFLNNKLLTSHLSLVTIGVLLGILPLWHTHTFIFMGVAVGMWLIRIILNNLKRVIRGRGSDSAQSRLFSWRALAGEELAAGPAYLINALKPLLITFGVAFLLALPVFIWFKQQISHTSFLHFTLGWAPSQKNFIFFWLTNSGLILPLALIGMWLMAKTGDSSRVIFFLPAWFMFIVANLVQFQPWDWDNIKLFSWVFLFLAILAGSTLAKLFYRNILMRLISIICLISLIATGTLSLILITQQTYGIYSKDDIVLTDWIKSHTKPTDVILIDPQPTHPVSGLTGRSVYLGYPGHLWVHGIDYGKRESLARDVLGGNVDRLKDAEVPINYIVVPATSQAIFNHYTILQQVFQSQRFIVYKYLLS